MQVVNNSDAFNAPTGTGAVIFDYPNEQPLDILLKANQDIDNWNKARAQRALQDRERRAKMFADLDFSVKGALPQDIRDVIQPAVNEAFDYFAKNVAPLDESSPEYAKNLVEFKRKKANAEYLVGESVNHQGQFAELQKPLDPTKVDIDAAHTDAAIAKMLPLDKRIDYLNRIGSLIKPRKESLDEIILEGIKTTTQHPTTTSVTEEKVGGNNISIETTETVPYSKAVEFANGWLNNNFKGFKDKIYGRVDEWLQKGADANGMPIDPNAKYYYDKAATYTGANGEKYTPAELYAADEIYKYNSRNVAKQKLGEDPYASSYLSALGKRDVEDQDGAALVDLVSGIYTGKPELFHPKKVTINGKEFNAVATDALNSYSLGTFPVVDDNKVVGNADNNILETLKAQDGRVFVKTTETYNRSLTDPEFAKFPYIRFNSATELYNAIGAGLPADKKEKIMNGGKRYAEKKGAYNGGMGFNAEKIAPVSATDKNKFNAYFGQVVNVVPNPTSSAVPTRQELDAAKGASPKKQIKKTDIAAKAKAAGYTVAEYTDLLNKKGVEIIN